MFCWIYLRLAGDTRTFETSEGVRSTEATIYHVELIVGAGVCVRGRGGSMRVAAGAERGGPSRKDIRIGGDIVMGGNCGALSRMMRKGSVLGYLEWRWKASVLGMG